MHFQQMDPETLASILEHQEDILTPLVAADKQIYENASCVWCGSTTCIEEFDTDQWAPKPDESAPRAQQRPIPRYNLRCAECRCLFEPFTKLVIEIGNVARSRNPYEDG